MEQEENEETIDTIEDTLKGMLMDSAYIGKTLGKKSNELLNKINKISDDDHINKLEAIGLELLNMFNNVKGNMWAIADTLQNKLKNLNENNVEKMFESLNTKVLEYKMHRILVGSDNKYILSVPPHKDVQTNFPSVSTNDEVKIEKQDSDNEYDDKTQKELGINYENQVTLKDIKVKNRVNLSLRKKNDTQDTDDCWIDSINNRSPCALELWNRDYEGGEKNVTDEHLDKLKKEQNEEELRNQETPELNHDSSDDSFIGEHMDELKKEQNEEELRNQKTPELNYASSDDSFIDGKTPQTEIVRQPDCESLSENKEDIEPELSPKLDDESLVGEENKLSDDTSRNTKNFVSPEDNDGENNSLGSDDIVCDSNTDISDSEKDNIMENPKSRDMSTDDELHITCDSNTDISDSEKDNVEDPKSRNSSTNIDLHVQTGNLDTDSEIEIFSKSNNIPLEAVEIIVPDADKAVIENVTNVPETENFAALETEQCGSENELNSEETEILERGPYSVETVKLDSDTEEVTSTQTSENSEITMATQPFSDECRNLNVQSDQEENKIFSPNHLDELCSMSTEEIESENSEEIISSPNIVTHGSTIKETEIKDISCDSEIKEIMENILQLVSDNSENFKKSISNENINSAQLPSENDKIEKKLSLNLDNDKNLSPESVNEATSSKLPVDSLTLLSPNINLNLNEDANLSTNSLAPEKAANSQLSDSISDNLDAIDKKTDGGPPVKPSNLYISNTNDLHSDEDINLSPKESLNPQLTGTKESELNEDKDCTTKQSLDFPNAQALILKKQESDAKLSSNPQLTDLKEANLDELNLSPNSSTSNIQASNANAESSNPQLLSTNEDGTPNLSPNYPLSKYNEVSDKTQPLKSPNLSSSDKKVSNSDEEASKVQISNDTGESSLDERDFPPHSLASKEIASNSNKPLEHLNFPPNSSTLDDKTVGTKQNLESSNLKFSVVENLESGENTNVSPNPVVSKGEDVLAIENKMSVVQSEKDIPTSSDSETIILTESETIVLTEPETIILTESESEPELVYNSRSLENVKSDGKNENLVAPEAPESQETEKTSFLLEPDETSRANQSAECSAQYDSDVTDICGNEHKLVRQMINSGDNDNFISLRNKSDCDGEENLSQGSNKSFEFDISENLEDIDQSKLSRRDKNPLIPVECEDETEDIDNRVRIDENDDKPLKDIVEDLEAVLSQKIESEGLDNDSDATISDVDRKGADSLNVQFSSDEINSIGKNESEIDTSKTNNNKSEVLGVKESIEVSDSDDEVHLDVTMEEILSDGSCIEQRVKKSEIVKTEKVEEDNEDFEDNEDVEDNKDVENIKPLINPECTPANDNLPEKENTDEAPPENGVGDELLELLREVEVRSISDLANNRLIDKKEAKDADEIFKMLQEENSLEMTDSDLSEKELKWDSNEPELLESESDENDVKKPDVVDDSKQKLINKHHMKECYVRIERLKLNEEDIVVVNKSLTDSIDRLCDINSLLNKRRYSPADEQEKLKAKKFKKAHKSTKKGTSDTESLSDISNSDTDNELQNDQIHSPILAAPIEQKLDDLLANEICKALKGGSDNESDDESDESRKSSETKKKGNRNGENSDNAKVSKPILSKEEKEKKAWKNDPLLRGKLDSDSCTSTGSEESVKKRPLKTRYEHDTDFKGISDADSDSDCSAVYQQNKAWLEEKLISPIKKNIPLSDSDSDSDCEFVPQRLSPQKYADDNEAGPSNSQKGRRNIRALMSDENLAEATQRANREEQERIERLEERCQVKESLTQSFSETYEEDSLILDVDEKLGVPLIIVHHKLTRRLKPHQRIGIQFMWDSCYESVERLKEHDGSGCILAHCMGLGKTLQVITLIHTLFSHDVTNTKHVLVVCPLSTVNNWKNEIKIAFSDFPGEMLRVLTLADKREISRKYEIVKKWRLRKKCVLVLGYEGFETITNEAKLEKAGTYIKQRMLEALVDPGPDLVICDEGHLLRNKKALKTLALNKIRTNRRIVLTGTPLQNNLLEYYFMVQFVKPNLLGTLKEFKTNFVNPITNGQYEDSTQHDIKLMLKRTHVLHKLLKKTIQRIEDTELKIYLPKMVDHAVFIQLHQVQVDLYNKFNEIVRETSENVIKKGFLSDYCVFQYIGTHPQLLSVMDNMKNKRIKERDLITNENENDNPICNIDGWWKAKIPEDASEKIEYGHKLVVVKSIIEECEEIGDKVLVFSPFLGELELIEHFLKKVGTAKCPSWQKKLDYFRMDGTVLPEDRSIICDKFNETGNKRMRLLLMSTKVGGLGLNLTAANRVIIMTVSWNPSFDTQSVFRVYRFGQEKEVYVYRLISLDTMEEKVYQRQVTKLAVAHRVVDKHQVTRHYKSIDLQEMYSSRPNAEEERPTPNVPEDKVLAKLLLKLPFIFKYHEHQALLANRPEDNLNEQELNAAWDEFKKIKDAPQVPPPLPALPQFPPTTGPTYSHAYSLMAKSRVTITEVDEDNLVQYYIPTSNLPNSQQKPDQPTENQMKKNIRQYTKINSNVSKRKVNTTSDSVITLIDDAVSEMIPLPAVDVNSKGADVEQDPLYISEKSKVGKSNGYYSQVMSYFSRKNLPIPKLPSTTSLFIEDESQKRSNQKENGELIRTPRLSNTSIVINDNDHVRRKTKAPKTVLTENKSAVNKNKRKRDSSIVTENVIKKMKKKFNHSSNSINLDDDTEITDTISESGSLSNEIIQNLGRSGITVHKVMKDSSRNSDVITLD